jgi:putative endonuclease
MPYMYILKCSDGTYYTGSAWSLKKRIKQHNAGEGANYTHCRLPVELVYREYFDSIKSVFEREKQVQGWSRKKKEALIKGDNEKLHMLAECKNTSHSRNARFGSAQRKPLGKGSE